MSGSSSGFRSRSRARSRPATASPSSHAPASRPSWQPALWQQPASRASSPRERSRSSAPRDARRHAPRRRSSHLRAPSSRREASLAMPSKRPRRHGGAAAKSELQGRNGVPCDGGGGLIVRWGLRELPGVLSELGIERPFLIASKRWWELDLPAVGRWSEVPSDRIDELALAAEGADGLLAVGGGSTIDLAKAVSVATGLPVVSVPTTYAGAEWATSFGIRDQERRMQGGGSGANLAGIVYDPDLTLGLPLGVTVGTAMNALAHCAEALYVKRRSPEADALALEGARTTRWRGWKNWRGSAASSACALSACPTKTSTSWASPRRSEVEQRRTPGRRRLPRLPSSYVPSGETSDRRMRWKRSLSSLLCFGRLSTHTRPGDGSRPLARPSRRRSSAS